MNRRSLLVFAAWITSSCAHWEDTRREIITPVNTLVHQSYPRALRSADVASVVELFAPTLREWATADTDQLLSRFSRIDRSRCVIHDSVAPDDDGAVVTACVLRLDGSRDGQPFTWEQERRITVQPAGDRWHITAVEPGRTREVAAGTRFVEEALARGLLHTNRSRGTLNREGERKTYLGSAGVAIGDIDGDGVDDLLLVSGDRLRLFRNTAGQFTDVTAAAGVVTPDTGECRAGYFADIDNDGDQDLFVAIFNGTNQLWRNRGDGTFEAVAPDRSGLVTRHGQTASACFGDFDNDGDLDLVLANGENMYRVDPEPEDNGRNAQPDQFFRNNGDGTFIEATRDVGLGCTGWALACATCDYDRDGDLDLYIANDVGVDVLYRNRGDGTFEDVTEASGCTFPGSSMSADFGDVNGDGWPDLYISGMASNSRWLLRQPGFPLPASFPLNLLFRDRIVDIIWNMLHGNRLYLNNGDGTFREVSTETRSYWLGWAWAAVFLDYDNDSDLDIYGLNGFWTGAEPEDC